MLADQQNAAGDLPEQTQSRSEGTSLVTKASALPNDGHLPKGEIDLEAETETCIVVGTLRPGGSSTAGQPLSAGPDLRSS